MDCFAEVMQAEVQRHVRQLFADVRQQASDFAFARILTGIALQQQRGGSAQMLGGSLHSMTFMQMAFVFPTTCCSLL